MSVVIVTYHNEADIAGCLTALRDAAPVAPADIIVVDNASGDGTVAAARAVPGVTVLERPDNGGFAAGCATGAAAASGDWLLFLNPDTVIAPDALAALADCARQHPAAGIVGGRFVHADGSSDPRSCWAAQPMVGALLRARAEQPAAGQPAVRPEAPRPWTGDLAADRAVPVVSGAFMLVRRELWDRLGGFDPVFFLYGEDADFCLRAAATGCRPVVTGRAVCQHAGAGPRPARQAGAAVHRQGHRAAAAFPPLAARAGRRPAARRGAAPGHGQPGHRHRLGGPAGPADRTRRRLACAVGGPR